MGVACNNLQPDPIGTADCKTVVLFHNTSVAPGVLTLTGQFYSDETVMIQTISNGQRNTVAQGTPASDRTSLTLTPFPSGDRFYQVVISCAAGQKDLGQYEFNVL